MSDSTKKKSGFNLRRIISLTTSWMFFVMGITGLVLYVVPQGRIAYWVDWHFLGLTKSNWGDIHIVSSVFFLIAGGWHLYYNWKAFINLLREKIAAGIKMRKELLITTALSGFVAISALFHVPPIGYLIDLNETIKNSWIESPDFEPPFGHAELLSLKSFSKKTGIDPKEALEILKRKGITVTSPEETLEEIAKNNGISPKDVFALIKDLQKRSSKEGKPKKGLTADDVFERFEGKGVGIMTVSDACVMGGEQVSKCLERLDRKGLQAQPTDTMKHAADANGLRPIQLLQIMLVESSP